MNIDARATIALTAVTPDDPERWFTVLIGAVEDIDGTDWDDLATALYERAESQGIPPALVERFVAAMSDADPTPGETVARLRGLTDLPALYRGLAQPVMP
jgi:hypothetical protein